MSYVQNIYNIHSLQIVDNINILQYDHRENYN